MHKLGACASCSLKGGDQMTGNDVPYRVLPLFKIEFKAVFTMQMQTSEMSQLRKCIRSGFSFFFFLLPFSRALRWKARSFCSMLHVLGCNYKRRKRQRVNNDRVKLVYGSEGRSRCVVYKRSRARSKSCTCNKRELDGNKV